MSKWQKQADAVLRQVFRDLPKDATLEQTKAAIKAAYPFGPRANAPYSAWLSMARWHLHARFPDERRRYETARLFERGLVSRGGLCGLKKSP